MYLHAHNRGEDTYLQMLNYLFYYLLGTHRLSKAKSSLWVRTWKSQHRCDLFGKNKSTWSIIVSGESSHVLFRGRTTWKLRVAWIVKSSDRLMMQCTI